MEGSLFATDPSARLSTARRMGEGEQHAEAETYCSTTEAFMLDVQRYLPSGSDLF